MISKQVEFLVKLRGALTMAAEATDEYLNSLTPPEVREEKVIWNPENLSWTIANGANGHYERTDDMTNPDFKALVIDLEKHDGKLTRDSDFYWLFTGKKTVGRKRRS